jgi:NMD protein affecting ribosome stability and mRNA decay
MSACTESDLPPRVCQVHGVCHTCGGTETHVAPSAGSRRTVVICAACRQPKPRPERVSEAEVDTVERILASNPRSNPLHWPEPIRGELRRVLSARTRTTA